MASSLTAVTGSTGHIGGRVAAALAASGAPMRLVVRDLAKAPRYDGVEVRAASYGDGAASRSALEGAEVLFMVSASETERRVDEHVTFVDAAAEAGVRHVIYTSFVGAALDATFTLARDHFATEERIRASGMGWTFLRDNLYLDYIPLFASEEGVLRGPAGEGRLAAVSQGDIAASAVSVLSRPDAHEGMSYELSGPDSFSLGEAAATMSRVLGRDIRYVDETLEEAYASRTSYGAPDWQVEAWVSTYTAIAVGEMDVMTDHVERLTGRPPTSLEQLLRR